MSYKTCHGSSIHGLFLYHNYVYGLFMVPIWSVYGPFLVPILSLYDPYMVPLWSLNGHYMFPFWSLYSPLMVLI